MSAEDVEPMEGPLQAFHAKYRDRTELRVIQTPPDLLNRRFDRGDVQAFLEQQLDGVGDQSLVVCGDPSDSLVWPKARLSDVRRQIAGALLRRVPDAIVLRERLPVGSSMWAPLTRGLVAKLRFFPIEEGDASLALAPRLFIDERRAPVEWVMRTGWKGHLGVLTVASAWSEANCHLYAYLKENPDLAERELRQIAVQFATDIAALHSEERIHCDVKLNNVTETGRVNDFEYAQVNGGVFLTPGSLGYSRGAYGDSAERVTSFEDNFAVARVLAEIFLGRSLARALPTCVDFRGLQEAFLKVIGASSLQSNTRELLSDLSISAATVQECANKISAFAA